MEPLAQIPEEGPRVPRSASHPLPAPILLTLTLLALPCTSHLDAQHREPILEGLGGSDLHQADLESGNLLLVVWASWSPKCRDIVERVNGLVARWSDQARVVTVNFQEEPDTVRRFLAGDRLRAPVFLDSEGAFSKRHAVSTLPGLLVFRNGAVAYRGTLPADPHPLIERVLGGAGGR